MITIGVTTVVLGFAIILFSAIVQGITAFGFALVSMPLLTLLLPLKIVVPLIVILTLFSGVTMLINVWSFVKLKKFMPLIISGAIATPLGAYLLLVIHEKVLKLIVGLLIVLFAIALWQGLSMKVKNEQFAYIPVGFSSGLLNGSLGLFGPPVVLFMTNQKEDKDSFRANFTAFGLILNLITIAYYGLSGMLSSEIIRYGFTFLPALLIGTMAGMFIARKINQTLFRTLTFLLIILSGLSASLTAIFYMNLPLF